MLGPRRYASDIASELAEGLRTGAISLASEPESLAHLRKAWANAILQMRLAYKLIVIILVLGLIAYFASLVFEAPNQTDLLLADAYAALALTALVISILLSVIQRRRLENLKYGFDRLREQRQSGPESEDLEQLKHLADFPRSHP
jgi:hypothetical protein